MSSLLDTETLDELIELSNEPGFMQKLVNGFIKDAETSIKKIHQDYEKELDKEMLAQLHPLKGSAMHIGAASLVDLTARIHKTIKEKNKTPLPQLLQQLDSRFNETSKALFKYIEQ